MINSIKDQLRKTTKLRILIRSTLMSYRRTRYGLKHVHKTFYSEDCKRLSRDLVAHEYSFCGPECTVGPKVELGAYVMLGPRVMIVGDDHLFDKPGVPTIFSGRPIKRETKIERDAWLGAGSIIMAGVTVGRGSIVAAGAIVTKDIPAYEIHAGVPAKKIKDRFDNEEDRNTHDAMLDQEPFMGEFCKPLETR